ncbi:amino acid adenylation domain-containing protein [Candidatus Bandiella numerosa]|uniref:amino acid adenylation domain-containing protein n=1 Tax=Candidatus Bandiella numerosa TaxID=2570586 RepID=UPI00249E964E|nr:non-ribosomal peptide synthetase [Candidatus Bandiella numerosa]WHA04412.1 amino acid adenylation domain-containing protein [Candidatus Bandiella numerosa]
MSKNKNISDIYGLSPLQSGLLFESVYKQNKDIYFVQNIYELKGELNVEAWQNAWQFTINSHESLRASFYWEKINEPVQIIHKYVKATWKICSWNKEWDHIKKLTKLSKEELTKGFDLTKAPLMRFNLIKVANNKYYFIWNKHHIILDGWCLPIIFQEVVENYEKIISSQTLKPSIKRPYKNYIIWLKTQDTEYATRYWGELLQGCKSTKLGNNVNESDGNYQFSFNTKDIQSLSQFAKKNNVTLNTIVQVIWGMVLAKLTRQNDIVFGVTISGRHIDLDGIEGMIGMFINTIPLRIKFKADEKISNLALNVQSTMSESLAHSYLSLSSIQAILQYGGDALFDNILAFENFPLNAMEENKNSISIRSLDFTEKTSYPLTVSVIPGRELHFRFSYKGSKFSKNRIELIANCLQNLTQQIINFPDEYLCNFSISSQEERIKLSKVDYTSNPDEDILSQYYKRLKKDSEKIALVDAGKHISYAELNKRADCLVNYLIEEGIKYDDIVCIVIPRGIEYIATMLAVLKVRGVVMGIDYSTSAARIEYALENSKCKIIIGLKEQEKKLSQLKAKVLLYEEGIERQERIVKSAKRAKEDLCYVLYTSGSSGKPKGVGLTYKGVENRLLWQRYLKGDVSCHKTSVNFGDYVCEIWGPLLHGVKNVIIKSEDLLDIKKLEIVCQKEKISNFIGVPSLYKTLIEEEFHWKFRKAVTSGEKIEIKALNEIKEKIAENVHNIYGSTEITADATCLDLIDKKEKDINIVDIGKGIRNVQIYILDKWQNMLPIGAVGEICIGGEGLARGYLNRPGLTAERFIANPFVTEEDIKRGYSRLYKTGDLGRYLSDGNIEYIGRNDEQVKIRGYRIELGEIESALQSYEGIRQSVVVAKEREVGDKYIVGYYVSEGEIDEEGLERYLGNKLPGYMVPSKLKRIERMPVTISGKIDKKGLPEVDFSIEENYVAPRNEVERKLCEIWGEVLGMEKVGIKDDFFKIGGHSLLATRLISRLRKEYKIEIKLMSLFDKKTIEGLSKIMEEELKKGEKRDIEIKVKEGRGNRGELSYAQQRLWFLDKLLPDVTIYNMPIALSLEGELDREALKKTINKIKERHEILRTVIREDEKGEVYQEVLKDIEVYSEVDISEEEDKTSKIEKHKKIEGSWKFNMERGPLWRVKLVKEGERKHVLLITLHHIVSDGWSIEVLSEEISEIYKSYIKGEEIKLEEMAIQYMDYSIWQREWLAGEELEKQLKYWKDKLSGIPAELGLPTDKKRPKELSYEGGHYNFEIEAETSKRLVEIGKEEGASLYMVLLSALKVLLHKLSGNEDIVIGSPIANRNYKETEKMIGFFVNTMISRREVKGGKKFNELLKEVREDVLKSYEHQDVPFEQIVDSLEVERATNRNPVFQVRLVVHEDMEKSIEMEGIKIGYLEGAVIQSKFDLLFRVYGVEDGKKEVRIEYLKDLYTRETIVRFGEYFKNILEGITNYKKVRVRDIEILSNAEKNIQSSLNNNTSIISDRVEKLFERGVEGYEDKIMLVGESKHITYGEVNEKANQIGSYLKKEQGLINSNMVGVVINRSIDYVIWIISIMKAGCGYVPIDPESNEHRIKYILHDSGVQLVLCESTTHDKIKSIYAQVINITKANYKNYSKKNISQKLSQKDLAYIVYTSGSTGEPKGVCIEHKSLVNYVRHIIDAGIIEGENVMYMNGIATDLGNTSLYGSIISGKKLYIAKAGEELDTSEIVEIIRRERIELIKLTPTYYSILREESGWEENKKRMEEVKFIIGGEKLNKEEIEGNIKIINHYGPTEGTIGAIVNQEIDYNNYNDIAIGKGISNVQVYILDKWQNMLPIGAIGEICIGGEGLARGYLNRPGLTAEKFIANPFTTEEDIKRGYSRVYKTGDLGRYLSNGNIEYIGRNDEQVKIRGYRIELGEIENVLLGHGDVKNCKVVVDEVSNEKKIVSYIVAGEFEPTDEDLNEYVNEYLPEYMQPNKYVILERLPFTSTGKIDKKRLPSVDWDIRGDEESYVAPRNEIERKMSEIWEEVLGIDKVGIKDNFFKMGGHSLLATRLISRLRKEYKIEIKLMSLFDKKTIEGLSKIIAEGLKKGVRRDIEIKVKEGRGNKGKLSYAQQRLWFLDKLLPDVTIYNMPIALSLEGKLDREALKKTINKIKERHEILRTVIREDEEGEVYQEVLKDIEVYSEVDISEEEDKSSKIEKHKKIEGSWKFNMERGPLWRVKLVKEGERKHVLLITLHHIVSDGWSIEVLSEEISEIYKSYIKGEEIKLEKLAIQYMDYSIWQREWLAGEELEKQLKYWKDKLSGIPAELGLPTDKKRPKELSYEGGHYNFEIEVETSKRLVEIGKEEGASLYMVLLSALKVLLHKLSGNEDIVIGSPIANRNYKETEKMIGFFVNTMISRGEVKGNKKFNELLSEVRNDILTSYEHQDIPFEQIVDSLEVERTTNKNPVFQVMFNMRNIVNSNKGLLLNVSTENIANPYKIAKFDIDLDCSYYANGTINFDIRYIKDLFYPKTIEAFAGYFSNILDNILTNKEIKLRNIKIIPDKREKNRGIEKEYIGGEGIIELFEKQVKEVPDRIAVVCGFKQMTYKEINEKSNQLARYLISKGIRKDSLVMLFIERSEYLLITILGILKAGGGYIPVDSSYPDKRVKYILSDTNAKMLIGSGEYGDRMEKISKEVKIDREDELLTELIDSKEMEENISKEGRGNLYIKVSSYNIAYVIYTSGTTGRPKGVMVNHGGMLNHLMEKVRGLKYTKKDIIAQTATQVFDISVWQLFIAIIKGSKEVIIKQESVLDSNELMEMLRKENISVLELVPTQIEYLLEKYRSSKIRMLLVTGEAFKKVLREEILSKMKGVEIINAYGPTECSDDVTHYIFDGRSKSIENNITPIGKLIANTQIYIVDQYMSLLPTGAIGELYVGGAGLARGYLNRSGLTAEKFIANPFATEGDIKRGYSRLYRTGDLGRYLSDGNIEYIGRNDEQVKIRGYRIELGEIENVIQAYTGIKQGVVVAKVREGGNKYLVGYYVSEEELNEEDMENYLGKKLPEYMIPSKLMKIEKIPVTINGKIDKKGLPEPEFSNEEGYVAPRNEIEEKSCKIWEEVLGIDKVGIKDDFFKMGGHSLLATRLISRLRKEYKIEIKLMSLFDKKTIEGLSKIIAEGLKKGVRRDIEIKVKEGRGNKGKLSYAQQRLWFLDKLLPDVTIYNMPIALSLEGKLDREALKKTINKIKERHEILRTVIREDEEGEVYQEVLKDIEVYSEVDISEEEDKSSKIEKHKKIEGSWKFNMERGPLWRVKLVKEGERKHVLLITLHHIVSDGWSIEVLSEEISEIYKSYIKGEEIKLEEMAIQYIDYSIWQREWLAGEELEKQLKYWKEKLSGIPAELGLPTDKKRPKELSYEGGHYNFEIEVETSKRLVEIGKEEGASLYMVLLSALKVLLHKLSGNEDIVIGSPIANRNYKETEKMIGFFVNTMISRGEVKGSKKFNELLSEVRNDILTSYEHQDVPFEQIVDSLEVERATNKNPVFQVRLVVHEAMEKGIEMEGIKISYLEGAVIQSKFDLLFRIYSIEDGKKGVRIEYLKDLYTRETIVRFGEYFKNILEAIANYKNVRVRDIEILSDIERNLHVNLVTKNPIDLDF